MKRILITGVLLCLTASHAMAAPGLNFNWNTSAQCPTVQTGNWNFACNTNDVIEYMVASVTPNIALVGFFALDARIDGQSVGGPIPAWWQTFNAGSCREAAFTPGVIDVNPTAPCAGSATTRLWTTQPVGGMGNWVYEPSNRFHTAVGFATAGNRTANLSTATQYNAFHIAVATTNTVAVAADPDNGVAEVVACAGCCQDMLLVLNYIGLYGSVAEDQVSQPMWVPYGTQIITYQGSGSAGCGVPTRNTTWGMLKSLYR